MKLSEKLRLLREEKGKTQEEVANELGFGIQTLRNYESDKIGRRPNTIQLMDLKNYYDVTYEYLLNDECINRTHKTGEIGKELGLSDKSINIIKTIEKKDIFNIFIQFYNFSDLIKYFDLYYKINKILTYDLSLIIYMCDLWEYIIDRNQKGKQQDLKEYFDKCDNAVNNIVNFTDNTIFDDSSDSKYERFRDNYLALKKFIFGKKIEGGRKNEKVQFQLEIVLDLFEEIRDKYTMYSKIIKLNINDIINTFLVAMEKMYDIALGTEDYAKMFGKYIEHINSDIKEDYKYYSNLFKRQKNKF